MAEKKTFYIQIFIWVSSSISVMLVLLTIAIEFRYSTMLSYNFDIITFNRNALASTKKTRTGTTVPPDKFSPSDKTSKQRVAPETTCCNTYHASSSTCTGPYSSNFGILDLFEIITGAIFVICGLEYLPRLSASLTLHFSHSAVFCSSFRNNQGFTGST